MFLLRHYIRTWTTEFHCMCQKINTRLIKRFTLNGTQNLFVNFRKIDIHILALRAFIFCRNKVYFTNIMPFKKRNIKLTIFSVLAIITI